MEIQIIDMLIPKSNKETRPQVRRTPSSITIHETDNTNARANASAHARLQYNGNRRIASWHYQVDDEPEIYRSIPDDEISYHAGNSKGNRTSISIEICVNKDGDYKQAVKNAIKLVKHLLVEHPQISVDEVYQHNFWSGKNCPRRMRGVTHGVSWKTFMDAVKEKDDAIHIDKPKKPAYTTTNNNFKIGDSVKIKNTAKRYATGESIPERYKGKADKVIQRGSNRMLLEGVYSWVKTSDLELIKNIASKPKPEAKPKPNKEQKPATIRSGSKVAIKKTAKRYATGETIPSRYKGNQYEVQQKKGDRVLLKELQSWVYLTDIEGGGTSKRPAKINLSVGSRVKIKNSASSYSRVNVEIPNRYKGKTFTIQQTAGDDVLLKELYSWVRKSDLT